MLRIENLQVVYGKVQALWGVSLSIDAGQIVALVGANGAGKTSLLKTISGLLKPASGSIIFEDIPLEQAAPTQIVRLGLIHVPEGRKLFPEMSVLENLLLGAYCTPAGQREERLEQVFSVFPVLKGRRSQIAGTLSGGEQQMVAIGRGLMARRNFLCWTSRRLVCPRY